MSKSFHKYTATYIYIRTMVELALSLPFPAILHTGPCKTSVSEKFLLVYHRQTPAKAIAAKNDSIRTACGYRPLFASDVTLGV